MVVQPGNGIAIVDRASNPAELIVEGIGNPVVGIGADGALTEGVVFKTAAAAVGTIDNFLFFNSVF
ncbi:hypothetical protein [Microbulbifer sp. VAAF005]|uniref:hypothetical protein n=1 Tax=Microbulbifer sp. VAAF005 TaxID=3034230 RepID=UPI0024AE09F1|nr:hypothetical protein [Microbulbifer sp. VAAF005]WHI47315.1 hypothetical protein P0078_02745 [Microbulbifer sp. VAAF005]